MDFGRLTSQIDRPENLLRLNNTCARGSTHYHSLANVPGSLNNNNINIIKSPDGEVERE